MTRTSPSRLVATGVLAAAALVSCGDRSTSSTSAPAAASAAPEVSEVGGTADRGSADGTVAPPSSGPPAVTSAPAPAAVTTVTTATTAAPPMTAATAASTAPPSTAAPTTTAAPVTTLLAPLPAVPRVLLVGDSTLLAVGDYGARGALLGMDPVYEAASCRALGQPSCGDDPPANSVRVLERVEGHVDVVVVMAGYDEWYTTFASSFEQVVAAARATGATRIVWLTYPEGVDYVLPDDRRADESLVNMNRIMREMVATGAYPDVVIAEWFTYASATEGWFSDDDIHLSSTGAFGLADYISRKVAFLAGQPCPMPREPGGAIESPCPDPDATGPVPDVVALYAS